MRFGSQQHLKERLKDKTWVYFNPVWVFGLEKLVGGLGEMGTCVQEANTLSLCVTSPTPAVLVLLWPEKSVKPQGQKGHPNSGKSSGVCVSKKPQTRHRPPKIKTQPISVASSRRVEGSVLFCIFFVCFIQRMNKQKHSSISMQGPDPSSFDF